MTERLWTWNQLRWNPSQLRFNKRAKSGSDEISSAAIMWSEAQITDYIKGNGALCLDSWMGYDYQHSLPDARVCGQRLNAGVRNETCSLFCQGGSGYNVTLFCVLSCIQTLFGDGYKCNTLWNSLKKNPLKCVIPLLAQTSLTRIQHHALDVWTEEKWSFEFVAATICLAVTTWTVWCLQSHLVCVTYHSPHSTCLEGKSLALWSTHSSH